MNKYEALRLIALKGAYKPDVESNVRYVMRWYSKTFHTPLHAVYELPLDDIWLAFYEERYQDMEREDLEDEIVKALESPGARQEREMEDEAERAAELDFMRMTQKMAEAPKALEKAAAAMAAVVPAPPVIEENIQMEFVDTAEMDKLMDGGMATETKTGFFK